VNKGIRHIWRRLSADEIGASISLRVAAVAALLVLATWAAYLMLDRPPLGVDDAYIFHVYGKNLIAGEGSVYYPGGERVEGFSSPLWLLVIVSGYALFGRIELFQLAVCLIAVSVGVGALWHQIDGSDRISGLGLLVPLWILVSPGYVIWMGLTLMDTALWSALLMLTAAVALGGNSPRYLAALVLLLLFSRPEAMVWSVVFIVAAAIVICARDGSHQAWSAARLHLAAYAGGLLALTLVRMLYFGYPLPNTYYAKLSPHIGFNLLQGGRYLREFLMDYPIVAFGTLGLAVAALALNGRWLLNLARWPLRRPHDARKAQLVAVSLIACTALAVPVSMGGDHFALYRHYQATWPLMILPLVSLLAEQQIKTCRGARCLLVGLFTLLVLLSPSARWTNETALGAIREEFLLADTGRRLGEALNELFPLDPPSVGVILAGAFALAYDGRVIDVLGLNNVAVAHNGGSRYGPKNHSAFSREVFLEQRPELFLPELESASTLAGQECHEVSRSYLVYPDSYLAGLLSEDTFWQLYQRARISRGSVGTLTYLLRSHLDELVNRGYLVQPLDCAPDF
jgi:arabinofuranosyltransferase